MFTFIDLGSHFWKAAPFFSVLLLKYSLMLQATVNSDFCCVPNKWGKDENLGSAIVLKRALQNWGWLDY